MQSPCVYGSHRLPDADSTKQILFWVKRSKRGSADISTDIYRVRLHAKMTATHAVRIVWLLLKHIFDKDAELAVSLGISRRRALIHARF